MIKPRVFEHTTPQWKVEDSYHVTRRNDGVTLFVPNGKCHITAGHIQWLMGQYLAKCCDAPDNGWVHPASPGAFVTLFLLALGDAVGASVGVEVSNPSSPHLLGGGTSRIWRSMKEGAHVRFSVSLSTRVISFPEKFVTDIARRFGSPRMMIAEEPFLELPKASPDFVERVKMLLDLKRIQGLEVNTSDRVNLIAQVRAGSIYDFQLGSD